MGLRFIRAPCAVVNAHFSLAADGGSSYCFRNGSWKVRLDAAKAALKIAAGRPAQISDLFAGIQYFWRIFLGHLLVGTLASVGFLFCIIPYFLVLMTFWPFTFVIVDQNVGLIESLQRSRELTANNLLTIFVLGLALIGINMGVMLTCGIGVIVAIPLITIIFAVAYRTMAGQLSAARN